MNLPIDTIVVPQGAEYQAVCRGLKKAGTNQVRVIAIAIGTKKIDELLPNLVAYNSRNVLILGLCGSLAPQHSLGDGVLYQDCQNLHREVVNLTPELKNLIQQRRSLKLVSGLTSDRLIYLAQEKLHLSQVYNASVVDMEGYGYIQNLQQCGISVAMVRVVSDNHQDNIPDLSQAIDPEGNLNSILMAIAFLRQPIAAVRLIRGSLIGLKSLQKITQDLFT